MRGRFLLLPPIFTATLTTSIYYFNYLLLSPILSIPAVLSPSTARCEDSSGYRGTKYDATGCGTCEKTSCSHSDTWEIKSTYRY